MEREEAMRNVAIATDTFVDEVKQAFDNLCRSKENIEFAISRIKRIAKLQAHQGRKSYQSPYAKFDKIMRKMKKTYSRKTYYKSVTQLNPSDSPSTGSIVCYDGDIEYSDDGEQPCVFVEIADCHQKVRLHQTHTDTLQEFIDKLDRMITKLTQFRNHLESKSPHKPIEQ